MDEIKQKYVKCMSSYLEGINNSKVISPFECLSSASKIPQKWVQHLIASVPELFWGITDKRILKLIETWGLKDTTDIHNIEGVLTCHALSPMGDTIQLLCDLGRTFRMASAINKKVHLLLANRDWTRFNWVAKDYGEHNLGNNQSWRIGLYKKLGCEYEIRGLSNDDQTRINIETLASWYSDFCRIIFGPSYMERKLEPDEVLQLKKKFKLIINGYDLFKYDIFKTKFRIEKTVIQNVLNHLRRLENDTFIYYLAQRFHQHHYSEFLKIAVRSEKKFDEPFAEMDALEGSLQRGVSKAIYFGDYILSQDEKTGVFIIPYYFPSGSLYKGKEHIDEYIDAVILLDDYGNKDKFVNLFSKMPYPHNARMLSDFLSFIHFYIYPQKDSFEDKRKFKKDIYEMIYKYSPSLAKSWKYYLRPAKDFSKLAETWTAYCFNYLPTNIEIPYYYIPYIILKEGDCKGISDLFFSIFSKVVQDINYPIWHK